MARARPFTVLVVVLAFLAAACGASSKPAHSTSPVRWPAPPNPMELAVKAGLVPEVAEQLLYHVHAHLDVFVNGASVVVPAGIGIDITNPKVHTSGSGDNVQYGGISVPCDKPCISPLHTHATDGILHTESSTHKDNTLGQFFIQWDVALSPTCVATYCSPATPIAVYVNGQKFTGDPRTIPLANLTEIAVVVGTPPATIPSAFPT